MSVQDVFIILVSESFKTNSDLISIRFLFFFFLTLLCHLDLLRSTLRLRLEGGHPVWVSYGYDADSDGLILNLESKTCLSAVVAMLICKQRCGLFSRSSIKI